MGISTDGGAMDVTGYLHPQYAQSFSEFGRPRELPLSRGWIIERDIPTTVDKDAMGCYPIFACRNWSLLEQDFSGLSESLVSVTVVTDPFGDYDEASLRRSFPDLVSPFKEHYVVDLQKDRNKVVSKHHRYEARKALKQLSVEFHPRPIEFLDEWLKLHDHLVAKHQVRGIAALSRSAFALQLTTPGIVLQWASCHGEPVAAMMHFSHGDTAYAHILGCNDLGYSQGALYALISTALDHFTGKVRWIDLMGVPGATDGGSEGIRQFKRGWTRETRIAWLCGRVFDRQRYGEIVQSSGTSHSRYFPAYRDGEMARTNREAGDGSEVTVSVQS